MEKFTLIKKPPKKEIKKMILEAGFIDCSNNCGTYFTLPCLEKYNKSYLIELRTVYADLGTKFYIDPDKEDPLDLTDLLIKKYFDKSEKEVVLVDYALDYGFNLKTESSSLFNYDKINVNLPTYLIEITVINNKIGEVDEEISYIRYKFISESKFAEWRDQYNFDLSRVLYSKGEIQYKGSDCTPERLEKVFNFLCAKIDQLHNLIDTAVKAFKKYYKDMKIKTISFKDFEETKNDA